MNYFDNEENILEWFRETFEQEVFCPVYSEVCEELYISLKSDEKYTDWINSSGKGDPPPDFYNPKTNMMMEVMRVDDHGHFVEGVKERRLLLWNGIGSCFGMQLVQLQLLQQ